VHWPREVGKIDAGDGFRPARLGLVAIFRRKLRVAIRLLDMLGGALLTDY